ncbi:28172_t:CDS:2 [Dentiscutata erythropus]|uniref:28172_t:CDS:1 n=1 Tax=Dentiscutata erythropus TaxID=1348616 RepID=A0A9N9A8Q0_9GLOM|nr:28172_t:CDS:2 [Dentiscutata erythropus]
MFREFIRNTIANDTCCNLEFCTSTQSCCGTHIGFNGACCNQDEVCCEVGGICCNKGQKCCDSGCC